MSPRESIEMTPAEVDAFLRTRQHAVLATIGPDGAPDATIVPCRYDDGVLTVTVSAGHPARAAVSTDDRVCCAVETCPDYYGIRGVSVHGRAAASPHEPDVLAVRPEHVTSFDFAKIRERPT